MRQGGLVLVWDLFRFTPSFVNLLFYQRPSSSLTLELTGGGCLPSRAVIR